MNTARDQQLRRRFAWSIADQSVLSAASFVFAILVARSVTPHDFGILALTMSTYSLILGLGRALGSEALVLRFSLVGDVERSRVVPGALGVSVIVGSISGCCIAALGLLLSGDAFVLVILGAAAPLLLLQDAMRMSLMAAGKIAWAAAGSALWAVGQVSVTAALITLGNRSLSALVLGWALTAGLSVAWGWAGLGMGPSVRAAPSWVRANRDLVPLFLVEYLVISGSTWLVASILAVLSSPTELAGFRGAQLLMGPITVLISGASVIGIIEVRRFAMKGRLLAASGTMSLCFSVAGLGLGLILLGLPDRYGAMLLGQSWPLARPLILPIALATAAAGLSSGALTGLRASESVAASAKARTLTGMALLVLASTGALVLGAQGASLGLMAASAFGAGVYWWVLVRRSRVAGTLVG